MKNELWMVVALMCSVSCGSSTDDSETKGDDKADASAHEADADAKPSSEKKPESKAEEKSDSKGVETTTEHPVNEGEPPELADGFMRLTSAPVKAIAPGADVTFCQYAMAPVDHDMDILSVRGGQSKYGHHVVAFSYTGKGDENPDDIGPCSGDEFSMTDESGRPVGQGGFLGSAGSDVPDGAAFRLKKGDGIMLNMHFINVGDKEVDGTSYLDIKMVDAKPDQKVASIFTAINTKFDLQAHDETSVSMDCEVGSELKFVMMANHMHEWGTAETTELLRAGGGDTVMMREDQTWAPEMQFNAVYNKWPVAEPLVVHPGDTLRTTCHWMNTTADSIVFPREMCISAGFILTTGDHPTAPGACVNGKWMGR